MSDSGRKVIHTDVDTGLCVVNDSGDEQDDEVLYIASICTYLNNFLGQFALLQRGC